jgi:hypothetical protein
MILQWVIIIVLIVFALVFLKFDHHARKIKFIVLILIAFLLYISISGVFSTRNVNLDSPRGIINGVYVYFGWLGNTIGNLWDIGVNTARTVGNAVKINSSEEIPKR